jgi:DNA topoisomerase I
MEGDFIYVTDEKPGYTRKQEKGEWVYIDEEGNILTNKNIVKRLEMLAIPPSWTRVWICKSEKGYLQATGFDQKDRKQYIYHPDWVSMRNQVKFARLVEFAKALPNIRKHLEKDLRLKRWPKEKVLALVVSIMDESFIRVGNQLYKQENETYGLTTLRRKHLTVKSDEMKFSYKGKSGQYRNVSIRNRYLARLVKRCAEMPGYEIFRYQSPKGKMEGVDSKDVNDYLKKISGANFSSKDYRTWGGSVKAVEYYQKARAEVLKSKRKKLTTVLIKEVAKSLGNTPAVCKEYYVHPHVLEVVEQNRLKHFEAKAMKQKKKFDSSYDFNEITTLLIIEEYDS